MRIVKSAKDLEKWKNDILTKQKRHEIIVSVCGGTGCQASGCQDVKGTFHKELTRKGMRQRVALKVTGCPGFCEKGPLVTISPQNIFYQKVKPQDVPEIISETIHWYVADVLHAVLPAGGFDLWHDRAVFHFLTDPAEVVRYAQIAAEAVRIGGHAVIGGFAPDGPKRCSGLPVSRRSAEDLAGVFAPRFSLVRKRKERHRTPAGTEQSFEYALMLRC